MKNNIGLVGFGRWGKIISKNLCKRNLNIFIATSQNKKKILSIIEEDKNQSKIIFFKNYKSMLKKTKLDGIVIASPPSSHEEIAINALNLRIPIFIEKPISMNSDSVDKIFKLALRKNVPIIVDYIHLYSPSFRKIKYLTRNRKIFQIISKGHSFGPVRNYSVLWDRLPHDLSMIRELCNKKNELVIIKNDIIKKNKFGMNIKITAKLKNIHIKISVGNLYKIKKRYVEVDYYKNNKAIYNDQKNLEKKLILNNKIISKKNDTPLDNIINKFLTNVTINKKNVKSFEKKIRSEMLLSKVITNDIETIYKSMDLNI